MQLDGLAILIEVWYYLYMPESQNHSAESNQRSEAEQLMAAWNSYVTSLDFHAVMDTTQPAVTEDGKIYELPSPAELPGDFAVVDMSGITVDTPHFHTNGEIEVHLPLEGSAIMSVGDQVIDLQVGDGQLVTPDTPHFVMPSEHYIVAVLSLPGYDPENQIPVDPANPPTGFNTELYLSTVENAG